MRMFRNKAAHLGGAVFRYMVLHDAEGRFHTFVPRHWPFIPEEYMHFSGAPAPAPAEPFPDLFKRTLVHEDILSYASGLCGKVTGVISAAMQVLDGAYQRFKDFPVNAAALAELEGNAEAYAFEHFGV